MVAIAGTVNGPHVTRAPNDSSPERLEPPMERSSPDKPRITF
jgi:hypothetical protein